MPNTAWTWSTIFFLNFRRSAVFLACSLTTTNAEPFQVAIPVGSSWTFFIPARSTIHPADNLIRPSRMGQALISGYLCFTLSNFDLSIIGLVKNEPLFLTLLGSGSLMALIAVTALRTV